MIQLSGTVAIPYPTLSPIMKTIVLATDFSDNARQAAFFAARLAHEQTARLILFHAFHLWPDNPAKTGDFPLSVKAMRESSQKSLEHLAESINTEIGSDLLIDCLAEEGHTMNAIRSVTTRKQADLLVMSTVGTAPRSTQLLGSIATGMVAETEVPLLLIPPGVGYAGLKNAVLCIDLSNPPNAIAFEKAAGFAKAFGCVINVLCISSKSNDAETQRQSGLIRRLLSQQPHTLTIETGEDVYETTLAFAHANKADLIMMLPQPHNWFWKLINEGETQRLARLTDLPLLAVV